MYMGTMIINGCFLKRNNEGQNAMEQVQSTRRKVNQGFYIPQNSFKNEGKISTLSDKQKLR